MTDTDHTPTLRDELDWIEWEIAQLRERERELVEQLADRENVDGD